jgi:hypothetical protein
MKLSRSTFLVLLIATACGENLSVSPKPGQVESQNENPIYQSDCVIDSASGYYLQKTAFLSGENEHSEENANQESNSLKTASTPTFEVHNDYFSAPGCSTESAVFSQDVQYEITRRGMAYGEGTEIDLKFRFVVLEFFSDAAVLFARTSESGGGICGLDWQMAVSRAFDGSLCGYSSLALPGGVTIDLPESDDSRFGVWQKSLQQLRFNDSPVAIESMRPTTLPSVILKRLNP